ncbi:hypothetical protein E8D34_09745 [Nocardioides sp. GY 10113]|uniref:phospholipase D-like domain-containing protein n=1 Tax=Nocardioides sp. GY 10113 TaxID=2569761 RepID=UPI0010A7E5BD|nr:phospholipase D-like domain-containing protein [Nocardioides sp. GY 10113]TIC87405.1 hypothetical protein E8D34_09745 [Nocardioides sp. GY 10113]
MSRVRHSLSLVLISTVLIGLLLAPQGSSAAAGTAQAAPGATAELGVTEGAARVAARQKFRVKSGVTFNSPVGNTATKRAIISKVNRAISNTRRGSQIRIFSWKIWTRAGVTALLNAQKRGVVVHAIMDKKNTVVEDNPHFWRLKRGLQAGNKGRKPAKRSGAILCDHSCRGKGGAAHSKFMLFSKSGASRYVYMHGSANWGDAAANLQWNDMYTFVGQKRIYDFAVKMFDQAYQDKPRKSPWREIRTSDGSAVLAWSPSDPRSKRNDRLMATLKKVRCTGATGGAGNANGRTIIRTAPDVIRGKRGMTVATQLRRLWREGCDVKIGYTVMGKDVFRLLNDGGARGPVPKKHFAQDFDGDGVFDRYFHLKVYTVNGVIGRDTSAYWMVSGSANTSQLGLVSDETYSYFFNKAKLTKRYQNHIDYWYRNYPESSVLTGGAERRIANGEIDPYAKIELD